MKNYPKLFIGPMSKNIVDAILSLDKQYLDKIALIPSRRQVEYNGGYVNNWTTKEFSEYVDKKIIIERDHGGPLQGYKKDKGKTSFSEDSKFMDIIHIDPWKMYSDLQDGAVATKKFIEYIHKKNKNCLFEVGTEQSIRKFEVNELDYLVNFLKDNLSKDVYSKIVYLVIQSGTSLKETVNTGSYDSKRLVEMIELANKHNLLSKEHNGDYLGSLIKNKFKLGLYAINIAPEFGVLETNIVLNNIKENNDQNFFDYFFDLCLKSKRWKKWVNDDFIPEQNKERLIQICGHYVFSDKRFLQLKSAYNLDYAIKQKIQERVKEIIGDIYG